MAVITTGQIVDFLDANLNEGWQDGLDRWPEEYDAIFNVQDSKKQSEKDSYETGFDSMPVKPEGTPATYDSTMPGISVKYTHLTYALGYEITEEAIEDNLHTPETFSKLPEALAGSANETIEVTAASIYNNGFTTNGFDGVSLFNTAHPLIGGGTQSNTLTTPADLSVTSLMAGITTFGKFLDERGNHRKLMPKLLAVAVDNQFVAEELLKSEYKPYTGNNERNSILSHDLEFTVNHYFTNAEYWFLLAQKAELHIKFFWRVHLGALRKGTDFDSTNLKHLARMRFSCGWSHYIGSFGVNGP